MKNSFKFINFNFALLFLIVSAAGVFAQNGLSSTGSPRQEKLLNGLKVLLWSDRSAQNVELKIRVHSGSAFDPQGKEGVMTMLAENLFPTDVSREYFTDDLGGSLNISVNHDFIQITATAKPENVLPLIETVSRAVTLLTIDKETTAKLKAVQLLKLSELKNNPDYLADQTVAKRLFGTFPYGRPVSGTSESVAKIDYADLLLARQRFLSADNSTLALSGNFAPDLAYRAIRRGFGNWEKSDKRVPANFRQPDEPDTKPLTITSPNIQNVEIRYAVRSLARNDKNFPAFQIYLQILRDRLTNSGNSVQISNSPHFLAGTLVFSRKIPPLSDSISGIPADNFIETLIGKTISQAEFDQAKSKVLAMRANLSAADSWLDSDTFNLGSAAADKTNFQTASAADAEAFRLKLSRQPFTATAIVPAK